jgi:hypothetical protein
MARVVMTINAIKHLDRLAEVASRLPFVDASIRGNSAWASEFMRN